MLVDVTQNFAVRVTPVNNPTKTNKYDEQQGYYRAYVTANTNDENFLRAAENEAMRGIVPSFVGYGSDGSVMGAIGRAMRDYEDKFGALCVVNTKDNGDAQ